MAKVKSTARGFIQATHFGPTVLVVTVSFFLSLTQYSASSSFEIAVAILAGQCVVGWTNDLIDLPLDRAAARQTKPLVAEKVSPTHLRGAIGISLLLAFALSYFGPLGFKGTAIHAVGLLSATIYNVKLKRTMLSVLHYAISFGAMPWAIYVSSGKTPPLWLYLGFILFACSFHFLNVMKDLDWDIAQGILGLPQRLGRKRSLLTATVLVLLGGLDLGIKWYSLIGK